MHLSLYVRWLITCTVLGIPATASSVRLDTTNYNFPLAGGGGGAQAILDQTVTIEMFCVNFANNIWVPYGPYYANVGTVTSGSDLSLTRFGGVTSWTNLNITGDAADSLTLNNANALGRYQMAAYLISLYHTADNPSGTAYNNGIQEAIWEILDPVGQATPNLADPTSALKAAASWFSGSTTSSRDAFLTNFRILSDVNLTSCGDGPKCGGFQEQIFMQASPVPEPRATVLLLASMLFAIGFLRKRSTEPSVK